MVARKKGKRYGGPWYSDYRELVMFEKGAAQQFPTLVYENHRLGRKLWREYALSMNVSEYEPRNVVIKMKPNRGSTPKVTVDGPTDSPHRFEDGELCMWFTYDPKENRWIFADGLLHFLVIIQAHLFREAWWRETGGVNGGEWLGPEVSHANTPGQID